MDQNKYPDEGQLFKASKKKHEALIFFVHFYKGHKKALRRHIEFVNQLGYDAYAYNLLDSVKDHYFIPYSHVSKKFGMKHALADQVETHLNLLPEYPKKIVFAFSNISGAAIEAMGRRTEQDIIALISDSGPSSRLVDSFINLFAQEAKKNFLLFNVGSLPIWSAFWSKEKHRDIAKDLQKLPNGFPVLSIRGWKDPLISPKHIDEVFDPCKNLTWQKLSLPEAGHLTGLRDFPDLYKPGVEKFLKGL